MPDEQQPNSAQNTSDGDGKNTGAGEAGDTQSSKSQDEATSKQTDKTFTQADLDKFAQKVRAEEKRKFEKELKDAQLSESERATKRVQELEREIRLRDARQEIAEAARKAGATNGEAVFILARGENVLEFDDKTGKVTNLRDVIEYARDKVPELFPKRPGSGNGGEGQAGSFSQNMNDLIRRSAGRQ
jgi:hypothetical protein